MDVENQFECHLRTPLLRSCCLMLCRFWLCRRGEPGRVSPKDSTVKIMLSDPVQVKFWLCGCGEPGRVSPKNSTVKIMLSHLVQVLVMPTWRTRSSVT